MSDPHEKLIHYVYERSGIDFSAYHPALLDKQFQHRRQETRVVDADEYISFLRQYPEELQRLLDSLCITYSMFFRDAGVFETLNDVVLPQLFQQKMQNGDDDFRIWCAGVATGEEAYSLAILVSEWIEQQAAPWNVQIFATDMNELALQKAQTALYSEESIQNVKYRVLQKFFIPEVNGFRVKSGIRDMVSFSRYDMMQPQTYVPPESIFGNFDLVFCRNVLMYFQKESQRTIVTKLHRSLSKGGFMVLGETELLPGSFQDSFAKLFRYHKMYEKIA